MKPFLIPLLACALPGAVRAQAPPPDTARVYKHELGLTASPALDHFFTANRSLPVGLLYKYHLSERNALRVRVVGQVNRNETELRYVDDSFDLPELLIQNRAWNALVYGGWEATRRLGRRWDAGYGAELGLSFGRGYYYTYNHSNYFPDSTGAVRHLSDRRITVSLGAQVRGFGAIGLRISRSIRLFAETAIVAAYDWEYYKGKPVLAFENTPLSDRRYSRALTVRFVPIQFIGAAVRF